MKIDKKNFLRTLIRFKVFPNIFFTHNPFKIFEFDDLKKDIEFLGEESILDIGCANGLQTLLLGKKCKYSIGIDISNKDIKDAKLISQYIGMRNIDFICTKIEDANFKDEFFDYIFSFSVLEHISNYENVLRHSYRILKKNGKLIFSVDALGTIYNDEIINKHKKDHFVEKYFKKEELETILRDIGFKNINVYYIFKSNFSKNLFIKGIFDQFRYGFLGSILNYNLLRYYENKCHENRCEKRGIFLIAKCSK